MGGAPQVWQRQSSNRASGPNARQVAATGGDWLGNCGEISNAGAQ
jgi:hypothetical protein